MPYVTDASLCPYCPVIAKVRVATVAPFEALFASSPDTPCRTTWPDGVECVEVPLADLRAAFASVKEGH